MSDLKVQRADILIIDDSETDTALVKETIESRMPDNKVYAVNEAAEAIKFLNKQEQYENAPRPDLILLDLKMPDLDGHEFLKVVKKDPRFEAIPVIVISGSEEPDDITKSYKLMANCFIVKPANFIKFEKIITVINDFWLGIARLPPKDI